MLAVDGVVPRGPLANYDVAQPVENEGGDDELVAQRRTLDGGPDGRLAEEVIELLASLGYDVSSLRVPD